MPESSCGVKTKNVEIGPWYHPTAAGLRRYDIIDLHEATGHQLVSIWILVLYRLSGRVGFSELQNEPTRKSGFFSLGAQRRAWTRPLKEVFATGCVVRGKISLGDRYK
jgi:hypothetical protein